MFWSGYDECVSNLIIFVFPCANNLIMREYSLQTVQEWNKSYIELIVLYVHPKNSNHLRSQSRAIMALDHKRLVPSKQNNPVAHLHHLYFIRLIGRHRNLISCYKGRLEDTIVLGGSQFTRLIYRLHWALSKSEAKIKNQAEIFRVWQVYFRNLANKSGGV